MADLLERLASWRAGLTGDFVDAEEAEKFVTMIEAQHPSELQAWMRQRAVDHVRLQLGNMRRSERQRAQSKRTRRQFANAVASGDEEDMRVATTGFSSLFYVVDTAGTNRALGDMNADDHHFVARNYGRHGRKELLKEAFHDAVAGKLGTRLTRDVFSWAKYQNLYDQMVPS